MKNIAVVVGAEVLTWQVAARLDDLTQANRYSVISVPRQTPAGIDNDVPVSTPRTVLDTNVQSRYRFTFTPRFVDLRAALRSDRLITIIAIASLPLLNCRTRICRDRSQAIRQIIQSTPYKSRRNVSHNGAAMWG